MLTEKDKINLQRLLQIYNFAHLRPPPQIYEINIPQQQQFVEVSGGKKKRFIFYQVPYLPDQQAKILQIKNKVRQANIYENYSEQLILKHLYSTDFNIEKCLERLKKIQDFQDNEVVTTLSKQTISKLKHGCIYTYGHDRNMKPIVIIRADKFDYQLNVDQNYNPVYFLMLVVLGYRTVPYYAQKYVCIFDLADMNMKDIPYKYLYDVFTRMSLYYCGNTQRTYIFNASGIGWLWNIAKSFIPEHALKKIVVVDSNNQEQILKHIDPLELQKKYGGKLENLTQYWPPKCTNQQFDAIQLLKSRQRQQDGMTNSSFYSVCNDLDYFGQKKQQGLCGNATCNCNIF